MHRQAIVGPQRAAPGRAWHVLLPADTSDFSGEGNEGKVMGLAPHGDPDALGLPPLDVDGAQVTIPGRWIEILRERGAFPLCG